MTAARGRIWVRRGGARRMEICGVRDGPGDGQRRRGFRCAIRPQVRPRCAREQRQPSIWSASFWLRRGPSEPRTSVAHPMCKQPRGRQTRITHMKMALKCHYRVRGVRDHALAAILVAQSTPQRARQWQNLRAGHNQCWLVPPQAAFLQAAALRPVAATEGNRPVPMLRHHTGRILLRALSSQAEVEGTADQRRSRDGLAASLTCKGPAAAVAAQRAVAELDARTLLWCVVCCVCLRAQRVGFTVIS